MKNILVKLSFPILIRLIYVIRLEIRPNINKPFITWREKQIAFRTVREMISNDFSSKDISNYIDSYSRDQGVLSKIESDCLSTIKIVGEYVKSRNEERKLFINDLRLYEKSKIKSLSKIGFNNEVTSVVNNYVNKYECFELLNDKNLVTPSNLFTEDLIKKDYYLLVKDQSRFTLLLIELLKEKLIIDHYAEVLLCHTTIWSKRRSTQITKVNTFSKAKNRLLTDNFEEKYKEELNSLAFPKTSCPNDMMTS
ncbi:hypothetical protein [Fulvivirga lutea]|uniref:Uncharacterized protein n=1 Tax=Fulvivirga lutea TaxID=2810512 RepID=A0A974WHI1_9BACT|nr:hypothetical protein [Fulvivirga lutea]QSE98638.1 hypothetical protein JR347_06050 [Fulvivirga lutea]